MRRLNEKEIEKIAEETKRKYPRLFKIMTEEG